MARSLRTLGRSVLRGWRRSLRCSTCRGKGRTLVDQHPVSVYDMDPRLGAEVLVNGGMPVRGRLRPCPECQGTGRRYPGYVVR